MDKMRKKVVVA